MTFLTKIFRKLKNRGVKLESSAVVATWSRYMAFNLSDALRECNYNPNTQAFKVIDMPDEMRGLVIYD